jgi:hypothetical protein
MSGLRRGPEAHCVRVLQPRPSDNPCGTAAEAGRPEWPDLRHDSPSVRRAPDHPEALGTATTLGGTSTTPGHPE